MKIAWFCIPAHGHTNPTLGLVKTLTDAGHQIWYFSFEEFREKIDTEGQDERLKYLRMKSWSWAGYTVCMLQAAGAVAAMVLGQRTIQIVLGWCVCLMLSCFWIFYLILSRKY